MDNKKSCKYKSAALALAVSMVLSNPLALTGCGNQNRDKDKEEDEQAQQTQQSTYHSTTPFIFHSNVNSNSGSTVNKESPKSWQAWTTPNSSGGYSGIHAGSAAG